MRKKLLIALLFPLLTFSQTTVTKVIDGGAGVGKFNLVIYTPAVVNSSLPAFVFVPGNGQTGNNASLLSVNGPLKFIQGGWKPNFIVVCAQTPYAGGTYNNPLSLPFMRAVMKEISSGAYGIDKTKIYLTGLSYGADHIVNYMQRETDANFIAPAAAIPMSISMYGTVGSYPNDALSGTDTRFATLPLWGFCGTSDDFYPYMSRYFSLLTKAGYVNKFTKYTGGHSGWNTYYDPNYKENGLNIYDWALQYATKSTTPPPVVIATNKPPVPVITALQAITAPTAWVLLDGSASYDSDGTIDSVAYTQVSGPSTATIIYTSCDLKGAAVGLVPGTYVFKLQIWDNKRAYALSLISVAVSPAPKSVLLTKAFAFSVDGVNQSKFTLTVYTDGSYLIQ
jgi:hypothetical protein